MSQQSAGSANPTFMPNPLSLLSLLRDLALSGLSRLSISFASLLFVTLHIATHRLMSLKARSLRLPLRLFHLQLRAKVPTL